MSPKNNFPHSFCQDGESDFPCRKMRLQTKSTKQCLDRNKKHIITTCLCKYAHPGSLFMPKLLFMNADRILEAKTIFMALKLTQSYLFIGIKQLQPLPPPN